MAKCQKAEVVKMLECLILKSIVNRMDLHSRALAVYKRERDGKVPKKSQSLQFCHCGYK